MAHHIFVTGATGTVGQALVKKLIEAKADFTVGTRDPKKAMSLFGPDVKAVAFDFSDSGTYQQATSGIDRIFVLGPPMDKNLDKLVIPFLDHLKTTGIKRVVYLSAKGAEEMDGLPFHTHVEEKLKEEKFDYTILRPTFYAQNFKNYEKENIMERGVTYAPAGEGKAAFIDVHDIGEVAAKALTEDGHEGKIYELTGPTAYSYFEAADLLSEVLGKKVVYPNPSNEEYRKTLKESGAPDFIADYMIPIYSMIRENKAGDISPNVEKVTGKKPTDFKAVIKRDFSRL